MAGQAAGGSGSAEGGCQIAAKAGDAEAVEDLEQQRRDPVVNLDLGEVSHAGVAQAKHVGHHAVAAAVERLEEDVALEVGQLALEVARRKAADVATERLGDY